MIRAWSIIGGIAVMFDLQRLLQISYCHLLGKCSGSLQLLVVQLFIAIASDDLRSSLVLVR
jgi:hypothetical protein